MIVLNNLVSIIIPTYNRADLISETLDSIISQSYKNWECIIVDDGSTDNTAEVIGDYLLRENRIKYFNRPKNCIKGANSCRNFGFEVSKGDFIKWFDSDDLMYIDFIEKQAKTLKDNEELDFCANFSSFFNVNGETEWVEVPENIENKNAISNFILGKLFFLTPATLWRRSSLINRQLFDETLFNAHETDFNFRRLVEKMNFEYSTEILFTVRRGHDSIDRNSNIDINSLQSKFDYFQKVFNYLLENIDHSTRDMMYVLQRQLGVFYIIRNLDSDFNSNFKNWKTLNKNIWKSPFRNVYFVKYIFASALILVFKIGYSFVSTKKLYQ